MNNDQILKLYANCLPVQGARRSIICDLQYQSYKFIPNALYDILTKHKGKTTLAIKEYYQHERDNQIDDYFKFILDNDLGFFCDQADSDNYPDLTLEWERPEIITNVILDIDPDNMYDLGKAAQEIALVNCKALQIRIFGGVSNNKIREILDYFRLGALQHIEILTGYHDDFTVEILNQLSDDHQRLNLVTFHGSPRDMVMPMYAKLMTVIYRIRKVDSAEHCGIINPALFDVTPDAFMESKLYNSCLNRKISVDVKGQICNCPSLQKRYGHITSTSFLEAIQTEGFEIPGKIRKDDIQICNHCEFRYICTDCRAFVVDPADILSKPAKCSYDPFLAKWNDNVNKREMDNERCERQ